MANVYIGADGVPIEQDDDGAFHVTAEKAKVSKEFKEIVNGRQGDIPDSKNKK